MHFCTRPWRNVDCNWAGEEKRKGKRKGRKGARDGDMKEKIIPYLSAGLFHSYVKLHYTSISQFPFRRISPYSLNNSVKEMSALGTTNNYATDVRPSDRAV